MVGYQGKDWDTVLLIIAALTTITEIVLVALARHGVLGHGDEEFVLYVRVGSMVGLLGIVIALVALAVGFAQRRNALGIASTAVLGASSAGIFLVALFKGAGLLFWWL
jgi:hypothetical protein